MRYYSIADRCVIDVDTSQYDFLVAVSKSRGDLNAAFASIPPVTRALKQAWVKDKRFWNAVRALQEQMSRAAALNADFVKDHIVAGCDGFMTKTQMAAINTAARVLGMGLATKSTKVEASADSIKVTFDEGMPSEATDTIPRPADPAPDPAPTRAEDNPNLTS